MTTRALDISLTVNGERVASVSRRARRSSIFCATISALTGSHVGCEHGVCGACTVRVNGEIVRGCLMLAAQCDGADGRNHRGPVRHRRGRRSAGRRSISATRCNAAFARRACCSPRRIYNMAFNLKTAKSLDLDFATIPFAIINEIIEK